MANGTTGLMSSATHLLSEGGADVLGRTRDERPRLGEASVTECRLPKGALEEGLRVAAVALAGWNYSPANECQNEHLWSSSKADAAW